MSSNTRIATDDPPWVWNGTVPSLNGLRALAILSVMASHYNRQFEGSWVIGHFGVTSFFVISGFLITLLLIRERKRTENVSLIGFYKRRALRILPAYFMFLFAMYLLHVAGILRTSAFSWLVALTYTSCFFAMKMDHHLSHTWSLSVEEHFYFLWPLLFRWTRPKTAVIILMVLLLINPVLRYVLYRLANPILDIDYSTPAQMGNIAVGCLIAFLVTGGCFPRLLDLLQRHPLKWMSAGILMILVSVVSLRQHLAIHHALSDPARSAAFGLIMLGLLYSHPTNLVNRFLNSGPLNWIGILSYSLYLWQQPIIREHARIPGGIPASMLLLLGIACASYYLIESPFLRLKQKRLNAQRV